MPTSPKLTNKMPDGSGTTPYFNPRYSETPANSAEFNFRLKTIASATSTLEAFVVAPSSCPKNTLEVVAQLPAVATVPFEVVLKLPSERRMFSVIGEDAGSHEEADT